MSEELPGYDAWKLATPPEYDIIGYECRVCGDWVEVEEDRDICPDCESYQENEAEGQ